MRRSARRSWSSTFQQGLRSPSHCTDVRGYLSYGDPENQDGMMRICDLTTLYIDGGTGGVNTYLLEKARYLADHGEMKDHTMIVPGARHARQSLFGSTLY